MHTSRQQVLDPLDGANRRRKADSHANMNLIQPDSFTKAKEGVLRKMNVKENDELLVWRCEPSKSFFISRGFIKAPLPLQHRSPDQHEKIISKFLIDYLNRKNVLDRGDFRVRQSLSKPIAKDDRRIDPSYTYRVGNEQVTTFHGKTVMAAARPCHRQNTRGGPLRL